MKTCSKCGEEKALTEFSKRQSQCKPCKADSSAKYRTENREKVRAQRADYLAKNKEKELARWAKYRAENREKLAADDAARYRRNKEAHRKRGKEWYAANRHRCAAYMRRWREDSPAYVAQLLRVPLAAIPPQLLELKREHLKLKRLIKELEQ